MKKLIGLGMIVASAAAVAAPTQLVVTPVFSGKSASNVAIDVIFSGESAAFQFKIATGVNSPEMVDVTQCLAGLPKNRSGACSFHKESGNVIGVVYSPDNTVIPAGSLKLGQISIQRGAKVGVAQFEAYDLKGNNIEASFVQASDSK